MTLNIDWLAPEILCAQAFFESWRAFQSHKRGDVQIVRDVITHGALEKWREYDAALQSICDFIAAHGEPAGEVN